MKYLLWIILVGWALVSILLHLAPGQWISPFMQLYDGSPQEIQAFTHAVLMGGFAFVLVCILLRHYGWSRVSVVALGLTMTFAGSMEWIQGMLPHEFNRQCDLLDLLPALFGALVGWAVGLGLHYVKGVGPTQ